MCTNGQVIVSGRGDKATASVLHSQLVTMHHHSKWWSTSSVRPHEKSRPNDKSLCSIYFNTQQNRTLSQVVIIAEEEKKMFIPQKHSLCAPKKLYDQFTRRRRRRRRHTQLLLALRMGDFSKTALQKRNAFLYPLFHPLIWHECVNPPGLLRRTSAISHTTTARVTPPLPPTLFVNAWAKVEHQRWQMFTNCLCLCAYACGPRNPMMRVPECANIPA